MRRTSCRLACSALVVAATFASVAPSQAGFFDFLFQPQSASPGYFRSSAPPLVIRKRHVVKPATMAPEKSAEPQVALCCKNGEDPQQALLRDPTLRPGDAVMMASGIRIFRGGRPDRHRVSDFSTIAATKDLPPAQKSQLKAIDVNNARLASSSVGTPSVQTADISSR
jgi:hypothetical protein